MRSRSQSPGTRTSTRPGCPGRAGSSAPAPNLGGIDAKPVPTHRPAHERLRGAFGSDAFGRRAESAARFFGTPQYIVGQTIVVVLWVVANSAALVGHWDPYPFILLNLAFSTQAAYAAPLILLAQTRQAERDQVHADWAAQHGESLADHTEKLLEQNTKLTEQIHRLTEELHRELMPKS